MPFNKAPTREQAEHFAAGYTQSMQDVAIIYEGIYQVTLGKQNEVEIDLASGVTITIKRSTILRPGGLNG